MTNLDALILALFKLVAPKPKDDQWRSPRGWFLHELARHDLSVSVSTLQRWCDEGVPDSRRQELEEVIDTIYRNAHRTRLAEIQAVRTTMGGV